MGTRSSVVVVLGTRPEIIKLGHLIRLLGPQATIVHTGQHFDDGLSQTFFDAFQLPAPARILDIGGDTRGAQIGRATVELDRFLAHTPTTAVVVQGDTNSALAGALAANANGTPLVHVESGLRSFDRRMPEEHNRVVADHLADLCAAPTDTNRANLLAEGIDSSRIHVTGSTVIEAVESLLPDPERRREILGRHGVEPAGFVLSTFHRPENVDDPEVLLAILTQLGRLPLPVILPLHPRTAQRIASDPTLDAAAARLRTIDPLGYPEFLGLAAEAALLIADSGGLQEETSVLKRPMVVVRRSTERPEVLGTFAVRVEPTDDIVAASSAWLDDLPGIHRALAATPSPYGDGSASRRIVGLIADLTGDPT